MKKHLFKLISLYTCFCALSTSAQFQKYDSNQDLLFLDHNNNNSSHYYDNSVDGEQIQFSQQNNSLNDLVFASVLVTLFAIVSGTAFYLWKKQLPTVRDNRVIITYCIVCYILYGFGFLVAFQSPLALVAWSTIALIGVSYKINYPNKTQKHQKGTRRKMGILTSVGTFGAISFFAICCIAVSQERAERERREYGGACC